MYLKKYITILITENKKVNFTSVCVCVCVIPLVPSFYPGSRGICGTDLAGHIFQLL